MSGVNGVEKKGRNNEECDQKNHAFKVACHVSDVL